MNASRNRPGRIAALCNVDSRPRYPIRSAEIPDPSGSCQAIARVPGRGALPHRVDCAIPFQARLYPAYYLDGEALYNAERYATYLDDRLLRQRLLALKSEAAFNLTTLKKLLDSVPSKKLLFYPCRMLALDDVLRNPLPEDVLLVASVPINYIWIHYQELNKNVAPYNLSFDDSDIATYAKLATTAQQLTIALQAACKAAIARLDALYTLELEVEVEEEQAENKPE